VDAYYADYVRSFPSLLNAGWGFTVETATAVIRLILSGMFKKYPDVKCIVGHLGEGLPFLLWRINQALSRPGHEPLDFRAKFRKHFWITTSGNFSTPALECSIAELGLDRIMFSIDYPFVANKPGVEWIDGLQMSAQDKAALASGNAKKLLRI